MLLKGSRAGTNLQRFDGGIGGEKNSIDDSFRDGHLTLDVTPVDKKPGERAAQKMEIDLVNVEKANLVPEI